MTAVLQTENVVKHFRSNFLIKKVKALNGVSLTVDEGDIFGFIGHNGAGKTTLIKILTGLSRPTSGSGEILGLPLGHVRSLANIGFLPERPYFYEYLSARESLRFFGKLFSMRKATLTRRIDELLHTLELSEHADRPMKSFSKGMLQRFGMAAAILHDPKLVILDEPMSGLDPIGRGKMKAIIRQLHEEGKTVFFSTHILSDVEELCNRMALISGGRARYQGSVDELLSQHESGIMFTFDSVNERQMRFLSSLQGRVVQKAAKTVLEISEEAQSQKLMKRFIEEGLNVEEMKPIRKSLEEIYIKEQSTKEDGVIDTGDDEGRQIER